MTARAVRHVAAAADRALRAARSDGRSHWAAVRVTSLSRDLLAECAGDEDRFYWERPEDGVALAASGCAHPIEADGARRFQASARSARALFTRIHLEGDPGPPVSGPLLVGGFAFADAAPRGEAWAGFPSLRLVLPTRSRVQTPAGSWNLALCEVEPHARRDQVEAALRAGLGPRANRARLDAHTEAPEYRAAPDRPHRAYRALVDAALRDVTAGDLEKVVLARSVRVSRAEPFDAPALLDTLRRAHPSCATFAVGRGNATFVGATPEGLLRLAGDRLESAALAGSAPRGRTPEEDAAQGRALVESKKEQAEHAVVVRAMREALAPHCRRLDVPEAPQLLRLEAIQHLETRITGTLTASRHLLELAGTLHPTPAVGGAPRETALRWLREHEQLERGWYAGAVGYVDADGGGELAVSLRSALLRGGDADVFAGAGIVAGSDPEAELRETRLKLRALVAPLLEL